MRKQLEIESSILFKTFAMERREAGAVPKTFALERREAGVHLFSHIPSLYYSTMTQNEQGPEKMVHNS